MIEGSIHQEDAEVLSVCAPNNKASKYIKQTFLELKGKVDKSTITARNLNTTSSHFSVTVFCYKVLNIFS